MPMSAAAMDGIKDNGNRWKRRITLSPYTAEIGKLNDLYDDGAGKQPTREELEPLVNKIVEKVRAFAKALFDRTVADDLNNRADELDMVSDCDIAEINHAMGELYDSFDYWRILVN